MIFLTSVNDTLELVTSSTADIDYQVNWVDVVAATSATPGSSQGKITTATSTVITAAPAASTSRQIKSIHIVNRHASTANTISVNKDISATDYKLTGDFILQAGDTLQYTQDNGWSLGSILVNTLTADIHTNYSDYEAIADPSAPGTDVLRIYAKKIVGRMLPKWKGPSGLDVVSQPAFFGNNIVMWNPGATSGVAFGTITTAITAGVATLPTTTNRYTSLRRSVFTVATGANLQNSLRTENMFFRGSTSGMGGFFAFFRMGFTTYTAGDRCFVGLATDTTALLTADPSSKFNLCGFGFDAADSAFTFIHNDGSGTAPKEPIAGQPALASGNAYDFYIWCKPNDTTVYFRMDDITAGATIIDTSVSVDLPVATIMLNAVAGMGSGANAGAGVAGFGLNRIYVETDY